MIAIKRLQSIMWILVVALGALSAYLISLKVATERNAVRALEQGIATKQANIRYLEVEFSARATTSQIEAWNRQEIRYSVPRAEQYLSSESQIAKLGRPEPVPALPSESPAETLPAVATPPVHVETVVPVRASLPAPASAPALAKPVRVTASDPAPVTRPVVAIASAKPAAAPATVSLVDKASPSQRRAMRLALLDQTLLGATPSGGKAPR